MEPGAYFNVLYPFQDAVIGVLMRLDTGFYLSGGTAASRYYLQHRFSDDLDFFVNDRPEFARWVDRFIQALQRVDAWRCEVLNRDATFVQLLVRSSDISLKVELINDVPAHVGQLAFDPQLGRVDSAENILANKITAVLSREEPKDLADIWGFCCEMGLPLVAALEDAGSKAAGVFGPDLARVLLSSSLADWQAIRWNKAPEPAAFVADLHTLGESLLLP